MAAPPSRCRVCKEPAIIDLPRHNANFCAEHFLELCRRQVTKAIEKFDMLSKDDRILVAVSGGKDSTRQALWVRDKFDVNPLLVCLGRPARQGGIAGVEQGALIQLDPSFCKA